MPNSIDGLYWETGWLPPYNERRSVRDFRPCEKGLERFFVVPWGCRFKVCFARLTSPPLPWAHTSFSPCHGVFDLTEERTFYRRELELAGFRPEDLLQWWVEYEELG
jgi:hypothetical protein